MPGCRSKRGNTFTLLTGTLDTYDRSITPNGCRHNQNGGAVAASFQLCIGRALGEYLSVEVDSVAPPCLTATLRLQANRIPKVGLDTSPSRHLAKEVSLVNLFEAALGTGPVVGEAGEDLGMSAHDTKRMRSPIVSYVTVSPTWARTATRHRSPCRRVLPSA